MWEVSTLGRTSAEAWGTSEVEIGSTAASEVLTYGWPRWMQGCMEETEPKVPMRFDATMGGMVQAPEFDGAIGDPLR